MNSTNRAAIVTGASRGIGAACARALGAAGYAVCVNHRSSGDDAAAVVASIVAAGGRAIAVAADTANESDVRRMFEAVDRELGTLAVLVNNAGIIGSKTRVADIDAAMLRQVLETNVVGYFVCAREAIRRMSTAAGGAGGAIVNISSRAAALGSPNEWVHYAASKGAVDTFTIGLAREVGGEGIRVNAVRPGLIDTEIHARSGDPERPNRMRAAIPFGRVGTAEEVAAAVLFLATDASSYVGGALLDVGGAR